MSSMKLKNILETIHVIPHSGFEFKRTPQDRIAGGKGDKKSIKDIAEKHKLPEYYISKQVQVGELVEKEHTSDIELANEIARDHLWENGNYYVILIINKLADEKDALILFNRLELKKDFISLNTPQANEPIKKEIPKDPPRTDPPVEPGAEEGSDSIEGLMEESVLRKIVKEMILREKIFKPGNYHSTFTSAVADAREVAERRGYTIDEDDWSREITFGKGKPRIGQSFRFSVQLLKNNKPSNHKLIINVYGMESGKFELNTYIS